MQRANLEGASLMACNFEDPTGVKSANLEGDLVEKQIRPSVFLSISIRTTHCFLFNLLLFFLLGVNMKSCDLEASQMSGVNLRVATMKGANLQNCNLRGAILAGADLEVSS